MLEFKHISKSFFENKVLQDISFSVNSGEILALAGQNGAGKSTLVKILLGIHQEDSGEIFIDNQKVHFNSVSDADEAGIGMVYQELSALPDLTVTENVVLSQDALQKSHFLNVKEQNASVRKVFEQLGVDIDVTRPLGEYPASTQQLVEIAKCIYKKPKILILDEPTTSLTVKEREKLFEVMDTMRKDDMAIIFITHYLEEMFRMADKLVVMRDGMVQYYGPMNEITEADLVNHMIGQRLDAFYPEIINTATEKPALEIKGFGGGIVEPCDLKVHYGEVIGLAGLIGSGRTELMHMIIGADRHTSGDLFIDGEKVRITDPGDALNHGIAYINEDRREGGLNLTLSIENNIVLPSLVRKRAQVVGKHGFLNRKGIKQLTEEMVKKLEIKCQSADNYCMTLSGGNQQKVSIAKWVAAEPRIYIFDEPTKGIDVLTKARVYHIIRDLAAAGNAIIVISSYNPELIGVCDRIKVMSMGKFTAVFGQGVTENDLMLAE